MSNSYRKKTKYTIISIFILIMGFSITITTFIEVKRASFKELQASFEREAGVISFIIYNRLMKNLVELKGIDRFYQSSTFVDREEFHTFVTPIIKELTEIKAIAWLPKISKEERIKFEKILKIEGFDYIKEYDKNSNLISAREREFYYPIYYSEPFEKNKKMIGFDVGSQKDKAYAIENSINNFSMYVTDKNKFLKDINSENEEGVVIFIPIYKNSKQKELNGILAGAIVLKKLFKNAFYKTPINNLIAELYSENSLLYSDKNNLREIEQSLFLKLFPINLEFNYNIHFTSKEWSIKVIASNIWIKNNSRYNYFVILPIGFLLTIITILYINALLEKRFKAENLVEKKIEELKKLNETLESRVKSEVEKNREKDILILQQSRLAMMGEMISAIAHQWRQPLTSIGLIIQKLNIKYKRGKIDEEFVDESTARVMKHVNFMSHTIDDFRNFFKPNKSRETFYIKESFEAVLTIIYEQLKHHNIEVVNNIRDDIKINGFKNEFEQVLLNIINNSKDAYEQKDISGLIIFDSFIEDGNIIITIEDEAGGIKNEIIDKIFDPYFTTKHESKGTGIGLYLAKMIIEQNMNGFLCIENSKKGAKFTIKLFFIK